MFLNSVAENAEAPEEMKKPKPKDSVLLPLMKHTFHDRRIFVQNDAASVVTNCYYTVYVLD